MRRPDEAYAGRAEHAPDGNRRRDPGLHLCGLLDHRQPHRAQRGGLNPNNRLDQFEEGNATGGHPGEVEARPAVSPSMTSRRFLSPWHASALRIATMGKLSSNSKQGGDDEMALAESGWDKT
jgi:hypothetical protein